MVSTIATFDQVEADLAGILATASGEGASLGITGDIALLQQVDARLEAVTTAENLLFGGDANWLDTNQSATLQQWMTAFFTDAQNSSDGGQITAAETTQLLATTLPSSVSTSEATEFIDRWNRTVQYWSEGIFTAAQVPAGQSTDFLDIGAIQTAFNAAVTAEQQSQVNGYSDVGAEVQGALAQFDNDLAGTGRLRHDQAPDRPDRHAHPLGIQRHADDHQQRRHGPDDQRRDGHQHHRRRRGTRPTASSTSPARATAGPSASSMASPRSRTTAPGRSRSRSSRMIRRRPTVPRSTISAARIGFTDPSGGAVTVPVFPSTITVDPQAELQLNYFLQQDVIGDDPFTPQVEPSEPAVLGLLVTNVGGGTANNLSITTAQPQIVQNEKGLLDTFQIIGTQVGNQQETPSLTVNFGDIAPGQTADASFLLESSLEGRVRQLHGHVQPLRCPGRHRDQPDHQRDDAHLDPRRRFQLSRQHRRHRLPGRGQRPTPKTCPTRSTSRTGRPPRSTSRPMPRPARSVRAAQLTYQVTANVTSGWDYLQLPDPGAGYTLYKVVRSDGTVIPVSDQAWTTDVTISPTGRNDGRLRAAHPRRQQHRLVPRLLSSRRRPHRPPSLRSRQSPARRAARWARSMSRSRNRSTPPRSRRRT